MLEQSIDFSEDSDASGPGSPVIPFQGSPPRYNSTPTGGTTSGNLREFTNQPMTRADINYNNQAILQELKKLSSSMETLSERLESVENRLESVESLQKSFTLNSSTDGSTEVQKRKVPSKTRVRKMLL